MSARAAFLCASIAALSGAAAARPASPAPQAATTAGTAGAAAPNQATPSADARTAAVWREALELDLPAEVLAGAARVEADPAAPAELAALVARALHGAGLDERAARVLARGRDAAPADRVHYALVEARIAIDLDEAPRAIALLSAPAAPANARTAEAATTRFPDAPEAALLLGRAFARQGDLARAEPLLASFVARAPFHVEAPQAFFVLVDCARARGDAAEATRREAARAQSAEWHAFYRARRIQARESPKEPLPRFGLAQLWLAANELARARAEVDAALALDPRFCRALELRAEIERKDGRLADAARSADDALACDADLVEVHLVRARIARDRGDEAATAQHLARYRELGGTRSL